MKKMIYFLVFLLILPTIYAGTDSISDFNPDLTSKSEVIVGIRDEQNAWSDLRIRYGLIGEGGILIYSDDPSLSKHQFDYFSEYQTINSGIGMISAEQEVRFKFSVGTMIEGEVMGFFYEFIPSTSEVLSVQPNQLKYYPEHQMFVNPHRYHIYLDDLIKLFGKEQVEVIGNKVFIYVPDGQYYNFDPPLGGDGIPTNCIINLVASYNQTNVTTGDDFKFGAKTSWSGLCTNQIIGWQDNSSGTWANIPALASDISCSGSTCSQSSPSSGVWYYRYPTCEADGQYGVRLRMSYRDESGSGQVLTTSSQEINCGDYDIPSIREVDMLYPANETSYDVGTEVSFQSNFTTNYADEGVYNFSLYHNVGGTWQLNQSWHSHIPVIPGKNLMTIYFNDTNTSLEGESPHSTTNQSIDLIDTDCFFGDRTCANCSADSGRFIYDDTDTLNISEGTICWWMQTLSAYSTGSKWIIFNYPNTNENIYYAWFGSSQQWGFKKEHSNNGYTLYYNPPSNPSAGDFFHTCISWDNSYTGIYIDGSKKASSTGYGAPTQKEGITEFFGRGTPISNCDCIVDELVIYDRRLSDDEITATFLLKNYTMNWTNQGHIPAGTYQWNTKAVFGTTGALPFLATARKWAGGNWTFTIIGEEISIPIFLLDQEDVEFQDYIIFAGSFLGVMWIGIILYMINKRKKGG